MDNFTIAIDLAKTVFEVAAADRRGKIIERKRLTRLQLQRYLQLQTGAHVVMESCGTAHYWGRWCIDHGLTVSLLPPLYVRPYVRRNKTDQADATALLEAYRASDIKPVSVKSIEQQAIQGLHRIRSRWLATRVARINALRGLCREFGVTAPAGSKRGLAELTQQLDDESSQIPTLLRPMLRELVAEIHDLAERSRVLESQLAELVKQSAICQRLRVS
jgi:transposase